MLFFASRRRHTRCLSDWSSDVCSSDLAGVIVRHHGGVGLTPLGERRDCGRVATGRVYETRVRYAQTQWEFRLVEVELDQPTRERSEERRVGKEGRGRGGGGQ